MEPAFAVPRWSPEDVWGSSTEDPIRATAVEESDPAALASTSSYKFTDPEDAWDTHSDAGLPQESVFDRSALTAPSPVNDISTPASDFQDTFEDAQQSFSQIALDPANSSTQQEQQMDEFDEDDFGDFGDGQANDQDDDGFGDFEEQPAVFAPVSFL